MDKNSNILNLGLAENRHKIQGATDGFVFTKWVPHSDHIVAMLNDKAYRKIFKISSEKGFIDNDTNKIKDVHINLYVTGLTVALISVLNVMSKENVTITLWHWNKYSQDYYKQDIIR